MDAKEAKKAALAAGRAAPAGIAQGYDSITGEGLNTPLVAEFANVDAVSIVRYQVCESLVEVMSALEINQSLSVGLGPIFSVNQKLEFVEEQELSTNTISIVVYAKKTTGRQMITHAMLRDGVLPPQTSDEFADFVQVYGDSYLVSRTLGGEYFAVYSYHSETREERNQLRLSMEAAGLIKPVSVGASLQVSLNNFNRQTRTHYTFDQRVTGISNPFTPSPDEIIQYAGEYLRTELDAPTLIAIETYGYERVPGIARSFIPVRQNVERITSFPFFSTLVRVTNDIKTVVEVYRVYGFGVEEVDDEKLHEVRKQARAGLESFEAAQSQYRENPIEPVGNIMQGMEWLENVGVPSLQFATSSVRFAGPYRASTQFDDVGDVRRSLLEHKRIVGLNMVELYIEGRGSPLHSVFVTYQDATGETHRVRRGVMSDEISTNRPDLAVRSPAAIVRLISTGPFNPGVAPIYYAEELVVELSNGQSISAGTPSLGPAFPRDTQLMPTPPKHFVLGFRTSAQYTSNWEVVYASFLPCLWL